MVNLCRFSTGFGNNNLFYLCRQLVDAELDAVEGKNTAVGPAHLRSTQSHAISFQTYSSATPTVREINDSARLPNSKY